MPLAVTNLYAIHGGGWEWWQLVFDCFFQVLWRFGDLINGLIMISRLLLHLLRPMFIIFAQHFKYNYFNCLVSLLWFHGNGIEINSQIKLPIKWIIRFSICSDRDRLKIIQYLVDTQKWANGISINIPYLINQSKNTDNCPIDTDYNLQFIVTLLDTLIDINLKTPQQYRKYQALDYYASISRIALH